MIDFKVLVRRHDGIEHIGDRRARHGETGIAVGRFDRCDDALRRPRAPRPYRENAAQPHGDEVEHVLHGSVEAGRHIAGAGSSLFR
jgi:hypothetical protein